MTFMTAFAVGQSAHAVPAPSPTAPEFTPEPEPTSQKPGAGAALCGWQIEMGCYAERVQAWERLRELFPQMPGFSKMGLRLIDNGRDPAIADMRYCVMHGNHASQSAAQSHQANQAIANTNIHYGC